MDAIGTLPVLALRRAVRGGSRGALVIIGLLLSVQGEVILRLLRLLPRMSRRAVRSET